jgi:hypothetical protein
MIDIHNSKKDDVIKGRCSIVAEIVNALKDIYKKSNDNQKAFIKTIIGAAIWYIPKPQNYWTRKISFNAIEGFRKNKFKPSEEHRIPRKIAAKKLLEMDELLTAEYVEDKYISEYCKLHYITSEENKQVIKYQKENIFDENNPDEVYEKANIKLIEINYTILKQLKEGNIEIINEIIKSHNCT